MLAALDHMDTTPLGLNISLLPYPGLLEDSRTLGWRQEHRWCSRIRNVDKEQVLAHNLNSFDAAGKAKMSPIQPLPEIYLSHTS
jgi:hypothetical protein